MQFYKRLSRHLHLYEVSSFNLGVFRVFLGIALLFQLFFFIIPIVPVIYFNDGPFGLEIHRTLLHGIGYSIFDLLHHHYLVWGVFALTIGLLFTFIIGFRTRIVALVLWILMFNIYQRAGISSGTESNYGMVLLSAACLLPMNAAFTFNRFRQSYSYSSRNYLLACGLLLVQIGWIYLVTGTLKDDAAWQNGSAMLRAFTEDPLNSYKYWIGKNLDVISGISYVIPFIEISVGLILICYPSRRSLLRYTAAAGLIFLHFGIVCFLNLWHFFFYALAAITVLFPFEWWRRNTEKTAAEVVDRNRKPRWSISALLLLCIMVLFHINGTELATKGYLSPLAKKVKLRALLTKTKIPKMGIAGPLWQSWGLYTIFPEHFGCVVFTATDTNGQNHNLLTNRTQNPSNCCDFYHLGQKEMEEIIRIPYLFNDLEDVRVMYEVMGKKLLKYYQMKGVIATDQMVDVSFRYLDDGELKVRKLLVCDTLQCVDQ